MKKTFIVTFSIFSLLLLSSTLSYAQTEKGHFMIGASTGKLNFGKSYTELSLDLKAGYFVVDNLAIGLTPSVGYESATYSNGDKSKSNSLGIGPFVRYYFGNTKLKPLLNASFLYYNSIQKSSYATITFPGIPSVDYKYEFKNKYKLLQVGGGVAYFLNDRLALDAIINYGRYIDYESVDYEKKGEVSISLGLQFFLN